MNKQQILNIITVGGSAILIVGAVTSAFHSKSGKDIAMSVVATIVGIAAFTSVVKPKTANKE